MPPPGSDTADMGYSDLSFALEVQRNLRRKCARSYVVRSAEGRKEVVKSVLVGDVDGRQVEVHLVVIGATHVLLTNGKVEQVARCDARRVFVVVLGSRRGNADQGRRVLRRRAGLKARRAGRGHSIACKPCFGLLIEGKPAQINWGSVVDCEGHRTQIG